MPGLSSVLCMLAKPLENMTRLLKYAKIAHGTNMSQVGGGAHPAEAAAATTAAGRTQQWATRATTQHNGRGRGHRMLCARCRFKFWTRRNSSTVFGKCTLNNNNSSNYLQQQQFQQQQWQQQLQSGGHKSYLYLRCRHIK